jgi:hypothetical protein
MKSIYFILFSLLSLVKAFSQELDASSAQTNLDALAGSRHSNGQIRTFDHTYLGIKGTPYLNEEWEQSLVLLRDGNLSKGEVKLDVYSDELRALKSDGDSIIVNAGLITSFHLVNSKRKFVFIMDPEGLGYFEVLAEGKDKSLICKRSKRIKKATSPGPYDAGNPYDEFIDIAPEYFILKEGRISPLKTTNNGIRVGLGEEAAKFMKKDKLSPKKEEELILIFKKSG